MQVPTRRPIRRHPVRNTLVALAIVFYPVVIGVAWLRVLVDSNHPSRSIGTPASGRLVGGDVIPPSGPGFTTYSYLGAAMGRINTWNNSKSQSVRSRIDCTTSPIACGWSARPAGAAAERWLRTVRTKTA